MDYIWSPWRYQYLSGAGRDTGCVFCNLVAEGRDEENLIVHRGEWNFVILNRFPYTSGHLMVVPYAHIDSLAGVPEPVTGEMMNLVRRSEVRLRRLYRPNGLNIGMNLGESAGAGIAGHIHMHVLPRWVGDANFMSTIGETRVLPEELAETWRRVHEAFEAPE